MRGDRADRGGRGLAGHLLGDGEKDVVRQRREAEPGGVATLRADQQAVLGDADAVVEIDGQGLGVVVEQIGALIHRILGDAVDLRQQQVVLIAQHVGRRRIGGAGDRGQDALQIADQLADGREALQRAIERIAGHADRVAEIGKGLGAVEQRLRGIVGAHVVDRRQDLQSSRQPVRRPVEQGGRRLQRQQIGARRRRKDNIRRDAPSSALRSRVRAAFDANWAPRY